MLLSGTDQTYLTSVFKGKVVSLEPEFATGTTLGSGPTTAPPAAPDEDRRDLPEHDRRRHRAQGGPARRIEEGTIDSSGPAYDFIQQNNETDWEFLWKLAARIDFEVLVIDHKLSFRKAGPRRARRTSTSSGATT